MADVKVKLNIKGIREVLKGRAATETVAAVAGRGARQAGDGFGYVVKPGRYTARAFIQTESLEGAKRQADEAVLERVMGSLR